MELIVNIGLNTARGGRITAAEAVAYLRDNGFDVTNHTIHVSDTEPTLVAEVKWPHQFSPMMARAMIGAIYEVATNCEQEAIAVYRPMTDGGSLIGPGATKWGAFDKSRFIDCSGNTLAPAVAAA